MLVYSFHSTHTLWGTASLCPARWMADITSVLLPQWPGSVRPTPLPLFLHKSALGRGISTCPAEEPSASFLIFIQGLQLTILFYHFQLLNISHISLFPFSFLTSALDWLGQDVIPRSSAVASYWILGSILPSVKPSTQIQI